MPDEPGRQRQDMGQALLDAGLVTSEQLEAARAAAQEGQSLVDVLLARGVITSRDVAVARSLQ